MFVLMPPEMQCVKNNESNFGKKGSMCPDRPDLQKGRFGQNNRLKADRLRWAEFYSARVFSHLDFY